MGAGLAGYSQYQVIASRELLPKPRTREHVPNEPKFHSPGDKGDS
jgi:hypothetical protein